MKRTYIKILSIALAIILALPLVSCGKGLFDGVESTEEELRVIGTVDGAEVHYDELYYLVMTCKDMLKSKYGEDIWKDEDSAAEYGDELREMVLSRITANYAVLSLCEDHGFKKPLENKELVEYVNDNIEEMVYVFAVQNGIKVEMKESFSGDITYKYEKGGYDKAYGIFKEVLAATYVTERVMRLTLGAEFAFATLTDILTGKNGEIIYEESDIEDFMFSDEFICTRHIFIQNDKGDDIEANRALAEEAYAKYQSGTPMDALMGSKYNEDVTLSAKPALYFTRGEYDKAYEDAAFALRVGQVSGIVETEDGFYIIERCEKSSSYMLGNFEAFAQQITYALVNQRVEAKQSTLSLEMNEFGSSLDLVKIAVEGERAKGESK